MTTWVILRAVAAAAGGIATAGNRAFAGWLRGRGVDKPYAAMGIGAGLAYVAAKRCQRNYIGRHGYHGGT